jgi:hypothetical protein
MNKQTNKHTYGKSTHSTGLCPLSGPLPKNQMTVGKNFSGASK